MKILNNIALTLVIIGALNWLLIGLFDFNVVEEVLGSINWLEKLVYIVVGISGLWSIFFYKAIND